MVKVWHTKTGRLLMSLKSWSDDHLEPAPTTSAAISRKQSEAPASAASMAAVPSSAAAGAISDAIEAALASDAAALQEGAAGGQGDGDSFESAASRDHLHHPYGGDEDQQPRAWVEGVWFVRSPTGGESPGDALGAFGEGVQLLAAATAERTVVLWDVVTGAKVKNGCQMVRTFSPLRM